MLPSDDLPTPASGLVAAKSEKIYYLFIADEIPKLTCARSPGICGLRV